MEPAQPAVIGTGLTNEQNVAEADPQIAPLADLKNLYSELKRMLDVSLEQNAPLEQFNDLVSILCARHLANESAGTQTAQQTEVAQSPPSEAPSQSAGDESRPQEEEKKERQLNPQEKFIYEDLIPNVASRLCKHAKTQNTKFTGLVGDSIQGLVDLLIIELRQKTFTSQLMVRAMLPVFDHSQPFYLHHH